MTKPTAPVVRGQEPAARIINRSTPQRGSRTRRPAKRIIKKRRRPKIDDEVRVTIPQLVREVHGDDGPRLELAFFSLPLWKGGVR